MFLYFVEVYACLLSPMAPAKVFVVVSGSMSLMLWRAFSSFLRNWESPSGAPVTRFWT